jgi:plastocyanin
MGFFCLMLAPVTAGEITGTVKVDAAAVKGRSENTNPNRKVTLKKYGLKEMRQAQAGGQGGPSPNEQIDERDFVVVFLSAQNDGAKLKATPKTVTVRQAKRQFYEHVTPIVIGSRVRFVNEDKFFHHIYCPDASNLNVPEHRGTVDRKPSKVGKYELFCDIHPLMNAYVYVVPNDWFTLAEKGKFKLGNVPPGNYVLEAWHPRLPAQTKKVSVKGATATVVDFNL